MVAVISKGLLEKAVRLHGHLGPFLILGLRMSLRAREILGGKPEKCVVETVNRKPYLCAIDGIRAVFEDVSIELCECGGLTAKFIGIDGREVTIIIKKKVVEENARVPWEKCEEYAYKLIQSDDSQLFE